VIRTIGLSKRYGDKLALNALSLEVRAGEVMGFLGPNGSGKTTTMRLLMGLLRPSAGEATIAGLDCVRDSVALKQKVGYLPDEPFLYPYLTGLEMLELGAGLHGKKAAAARKTARAAAERVELDETSLRATTSTYSLGMRKRLALALAILHEPEVLILDEPTNGLDPRGARQMRALMEEEATRGHTVLVSTHLLDAAERLCHRVAIIRSGSLQLVGAPAHLRAEAAAKGLPAQDLEALFLGITEAAP